MSGRFAITLLVLLCCCGDNEQAPGTFDGGDDRHCSQEYPGAVPVGCYAAQLFAARDTAALVPTQGEIDRYAERWTLVIDREPILTARVPQTYRNKPPSQMSILTTNAMVIAAWRMQQITTGDSDFDSIMSIVEVKDINPFFSNPGGSDTEFNFLVNVGKIYNEEEMERVLALTNSSLPAPIQSPKDDGQWAWIVGSTGNLDTAQIDFTFGWGDCFVACDGFRHLQAFVPPTGGAIVYDLGGDPLPEGLHLSPTTLPPP